MNKKTKTAFVCNSCGQEFGKWQGRCTNCNLWDTIVEFRVAASGTSRRAVNANPAGSAPVTLSSFTPDHLPRIHTPFTEVDRVLGGGLVPGAFVLLGGDPGIGKSTLMLQMAATFATGGTSTLYVSGEESCEQISIRAHRLKLSTAPVALMAETCVETILQHLDELKPGIVVIDSIQTVFSEALESAPGGVSQLRECAAMLLAYAKKHHTAMFLIGHVTKDGSIAGPRLLEHMVDAVLHFEGESHYQYRILRSIKNRFGPSGELAVFSMADRGLVEVGNPSEFFLSTRQDAQIGSAVAPILEGSRVLVVELQALVNRSHFGIPQRVASGVNPKKLSLLLAVLERHGGIILGDHDVFFNVAGGLTIAEPAADLGTVAAILSSYRNRPLKKGIALLGEVGLGGEIRAVNNMDLRLRELKRLGFSECLIPPPPAKANWGAAEEGFKPRFVEKIAAMQDFLF